MNLYRFALICCVLVAVPPMTVRLHADQAECVLVSAGAETDAVTGSIQNVGQVVVGRTSGTSVILHAGGIPCLVLHASCVLGDVNGDGRIDGLDVHPYTRVALTGVGTPRELCAADLDMLDFVSLLLE